MVGTLTKIDMYGLAAKYKDNLYLSLVLITEQGNIINSISFKKVGYIKDEYINKQVEYELQTSKDIGVTFERAIIIKILNQNKKLEI